MLHRSTANPILTRLDIPASTGVIDPSSVFNPGAAFFQGRIRLLMRVQSRSRSTFLLLASSTNGEDFEVRSLPVHFDGIERETRPIYHIYDPRLTVIGEELFVLFAADMEDACRVGVARTRDLEHFEFLGFSESPSRNGVLFPEQFAGRYLRLERPNQRVVAGGVSTGDAVFLAESRDLVQWELSDEPLFVGRPHYWDELIGSGPPPVKTRSGWLHIYHGVATHFASSNIYQAGAVLLDLDHPGRVLARTWNNVLEPREPYELMGQVPNVVFPSGLIVREFDEEGFARDDSEVLVYYGAADTCVGLCTSSVRELVQSCVPTED